MSRRSSTVVSFLAGVALAMPLASIFAAPLAAQHFPTDAELLEIIRTRVDEGRSTGIVVGVIEADGTRRIQAYGDAGPGALPLSAESVFEIGSISKVFTSILLADMAADGLLSIEDPVQSLAPDGLEVPSLPGQTIRFVDIATHHSALPGMPNNFSPADPTNPYADYTPAMMFEFLNGHELRRDVGSQFEYSNLAVGLMGHLLALKNGTDYETLVTERIWDPMGMDRTGITIMVEMAPHFVRGHDLSGEVTSYWDIPAMAGAGALRSDMNDMLDFIEANIGEPTSDLERSMRTTHQVQKVMGGPMSIGLNWVVQAVGDDEIIWHNGGTGGFRTFAGFDPARGVGAVVLTNSATSADDIGIHLINSVMPLAPAPEPTPEHVEVEVDRAVMERYVGVYELAPQVELKVTLGAEGLSVQLTAQPAFPIFAESETMFFLKVVEAQVEFVVEEGVVVAAILHQGGASQRAARIQ